MRRNFRAARGVGALLALVPIVGTSGGIAHGATAATITRLAGVIGSGPATSTAMQVDYDAVSGQRAYVADRAAGVIRSVDLRAQTTGVVAGDGTDGPNVVDGSFATSGAVNPGAMVVAPDGSLVYVDAATRWNGATPPGTIRRIGPTGTVSTVAGDGKFGLGGDGGPASAATFSSITQMTYDASGNLLVADEFNCRVREVTTAGIVTTIAGTVCGNESPNGTPATVATLGEIGGVAVDSTGTVYFSDTFEGNVVRKIDPSGNLVTVAGNGQTGPESGDGGPATAATIPSPGTIAVDDSGNLYITEFDGRIRRVDTAGIITTVAGGGTSTADGIPATQSTALSGVNVSGGIVYASDGRRLRMIDHQGDIRTVAGNGLTASSGDGGPAASAQVNDGAIAVRNGVVTVTGDAELRTFSPGGTISTRSLSGPALSAMSETASTGGNGSGMVEDSAGNVYLGSHMNGILKVDPAGVVTLVYSWLVLSVQAVDAAGNVYFVFGTPSPHDPTAGVAEYNPTTGQVVDLYTVMAEPDPQVVAVGPQGQVLFDLGCQVVRLVGPGVTVPVAGTGTCGDSGDGGPATLAQLRTIDALAFDPSGNLYISDDNHKVHEVSPTGTISTVAGTGTVGLGGDGGPATSATLDEVNGLATDPAGNLYLADRYRIREVHLGN